MSRKKDFLLSTEPPYRGRSTKKDCGGKGWEPWALCEGRVRGGDF